MNVLDRVLAQRLAAQFEEDKRQSRPISYEARKRRPWKEKALERGADWFGPQL